MVERPGSAGAATDQSREQRCARHGVWMVMPQEEVQDTGRTEHESVRVGVSRRLVGRKLPRLTRASAKERHQHNGNVRRALTPALLP